MATLTELKTRENDMESLNEPPDSRSQRRDNPLNQPVFWKNDREICNVSGETVEYVTPMPWPDLETQERLLSHAKQEHPQ